MRQKKSTTAAEGDGFPAFSPRLRNLLLPDKFKPLGITKYDAKQDPIQWLRCYALSIENAGGNSDTKCLYFPFCLDQAPLTWLESLDKHSIDKWDQLKEQFTSNFAGAMGRSGTRMDLAMIKQEQGETLRKYMRRFFDKRATVVDVTDKEVIDLFQDGLYHRRTFEDFGRRRPKSIPHLKDMITSWADEEDKANAKYDAIRGKSKQNQGGGSSSNPNQGGRNNNNNNNFSGSNRKRKPDNTVAAIQRPPKGNSKKNSGGFKDLLKEKCRGTRTATTLPSSATSSGMHSRIRRSHRTLTIKEQEEGRRTRLPRTREDRQRPLRRTTLQAGAEGYSP